MEEITILFDFLVSEQLTILEYLRKTYFSCWSSHIIFNLGFGNKRFRISQFFKIWIFKALIGYNFYVTGYRLLQLLDFVDNDVSVDYNPHVCCIKQLVTTGRVIPYKYHQLSLIILLLSKLLWNMLIRYETKNSQILYIQFESRPCFLQCYLLNLLCWTPI